MKTVHMPGFTAAAALVPKKGTYYNSSTETPVKGIVVPQIFNSFRRCYSACRKAGGSRWHCFWDC